jgi:hypothetical protein
MLHPIAVRRLLLALAGVTLFVGVLFYGYFPHPIIDGDTAVLLQGAHAVKNCLEVGNRPCGGSWHFPLLQYVEAVLLLRNGDNDSDVLAFYAKASMFSFLGVVLLGTAFLFRRGLQASAAFFALALLSSFMLWHFNGTYGESVACFLTFVFALCVLARRWPVLMGVAAFFAAVTKETNAPCLLAFALVPLLRESGTVRERLRKDRRFLVATGLGVALGVAANLEFNVFRFGVPQNTFLLDPILQVPGLGQHLYHLAGLWLSPNGGLLPFAPWLTAALVFLAIPSKEASWQSRLASAAPLLLLGVLTLGLARWFSPFGWWTWGARLCVPWLPALLLTALTFEGERLEARLRPLFKHWPAVVAIAAVVVLFAVPHLVMLQAADIFYGFFDGNQDCQRLIDVRGNPTAFYACHNALIFPRYEFMPLQALAAWDRDVIRWPLYGYVSLLLGLCLWLRRELAKA